MTKSINAALAAAAVWLALGAVPARAEVVYPWCAIYNGGNSGTNCGFQTWAQCMATIRGIGGTCYPNGNYHGSVRKYRHRRSANEQPVELWSFLRSMDVQYPWCAHYNMSGSDGGTNCGFYNREQCMAAISGVGGSCYENLAYSPPAPHRKRVRRN